MNLSDFDYVISKKFISRKNLSDCIAQIILVKLGFLIKMLFLYFQARDIIPTIEANLPDEESNLKDEPNQNFEPRQNQNSEPLEDDFNDNFMDQDPDPPDSAPEDVSQEATSKPVQKTSKSAKKSKSKKSNVKPESDSNIDQEEVQCYYCCVMISRSEIESHMRNDHGRYSGMDFFTQCENFKNFSATKILCEIRIMFCVKSHLTSDKIFCEIK